MFVILGGRTVKIKLVQDRWEVIKKFVVGKEMLDVGCMGFLAKAM